MMLDWNEYRKQLATEVKEIGQLSPDTIKGYMALSAAGQKADLLGGKVRELIALAVAVSLRCDGCITVHTEAAIKQGATREQIVEALVSQRLSTPARRLSTPLAFWMLLRNIRAPSGRSQMLDSVGELRCR